MTAAAIKANDIFVVQVSDPHLFASPDGELRGVQTDVSLRLVLEQVRQENGDLLLLTGDLVQDETRVGYERLKTYVDELSLPTFAIPGNHDDPELLEQTLTDARSQVCGHTVVGNWCIVMLNSYLAGSAGGKLSDQELARLQDTLGRFADKHVMIVLHHHPVPMGSAWLDTVGLENNESFWALVDEHDNVRCVVWGHVHQDLNSERKGVRLLATPSTCAQFKPKVDEFEIDQEKAPAYRRIRLYDSGEIDSDVVWLQD